MSDAEISSIKLQIDEAKEYLENNLCQQCADMAYRIQILQEKLDKILKDR